MNRAACLVLALTVAGCGSSGPAITGTATFAGGPAVPADAVLEATLLELAGTGTPGRVIGSVLVGGPGRPPVAFRIPYDAAQIDSGRDYTVRARVLADRSVLFLADSGTAVLTRGHGRAVAISLIPATVTRQLPATFAGTLSCDSCVGVAYQIDLLPDSVFYLRAIRRGSGDSTVREDIGRWSLEADGARLTLRGRTVETFAAFGASVLRPLGADGRPSAGSQEHELLRTSAVSPLEPALPLRGLYRESGGGTFADCRTRTPLSVDTGGERTALEAAYRRAGGRPGGEVLVRLDGQIVRTSGSRAGAVRVLRVLGASRTERC
jgi:uncharacterized lipoprotein YbaY